MISTLIFASGGHPQFLILLRRSPCIEDNKFYVHGKRRVQKGILPVLSFGYF